MVTQAESGVQRGCGISLFWILGRFLCQKQHLKCPISTWTQIELGVASFGIWLSHFEGVTFSWDLGFF